MNVALGDGGQRVDLVHAGTSFFSESISNQL